MKQSVDIAIARGDKFVAIRSHKHNYQASLPGGKVEKAESLVDAAIRETYEETGLVVTRITPYYSAPIGPYICTAFVAKAIGEMRGSKEGEVILATREELLDGPYGDYYQDMFKYYDDLQL